MVNCFLCDEKFLNNLGGQLTNHLSSRHDMTLEEYVILFDYGGIAPKCECGLCNSTAHFYRGRFNRYAQFHNQSRVKMKFWLEKYGQPKCKVCGSDVKFYRGKPRDFCSRSCCAKNGNGFCNPQVQEKIKKVVLNKYGVSNVSRIEFVQKKISKALSGRFVGRKISDEIKKKMSLASIDMWEKEGFKRAQAFRIKRAINSNQNELIRRSKFMFAKRKDPLFNEKIFLNSKNRLTKLHQKIRNILALDDFGFISEKRIDKYFVDEINEQKNIIIEIFGDYTHANPKIYKSEDVIRLYGQSYTAGEKWEKDEIRINNLKKQGYNVIIIWQSDDLEEKKKEIMKLLNREIK